MGWAASLDPSPEVIHIDMRSPTRNSYLGGGGWATTLWRELRRQLPSLKFLHLTPLLSSVDQLLNSMRTNPVGKPAGWYRQVSITEKEGGVERKTNLTLPSYVWVGGETAKLPNAAEGETVAAFLCLFQISDPPKRKNFFLLRVCFLWEGGYTGREVWQKLHRGGGIHQVGGYDPPPFVVEATAEWVRQYAPKGGRPGKQTKRGAEVVVVEADAPPSPIGVRAPPPPPSPPPSRRRWRRWRPSPPLRPWMWRPWGPVWPPT